MNSFFNAFAFALIAAVGNAIFVYGQKKSIPGENPFWFIILSLVGCIALLSFASLFFPFPHVKSWLNLNIRAILVTSIGLFTTYVGFYLLYSRFGASYYTLYAVLSIVTTSIIVAIFVFHERFNFYYLAAIASALLTIVFFFLGQKKS